jgi:UDP-glucose 4-epimerase
VQPVVLRASNPYGPRQGHTGIQGLIGTHLWRLARKEQIEVWGDGSVVRDFLHVKDLAALCLRALQADITGIFNAGSGEGASVAEGGDKICATVGGDVTPLYKPGRNFDVPRVVLDVTKAEAELGWQRQIPLDVGLAETWAWVQAQTQV